MPVIRTEHHWRLHAAQDVDSIPNLDLQRRNTDISSTGEANSPPVEKIINPKIFIHFPRRLLMDTAPSNRMLNGCAYASPYEVLERLKTFYSLQVAEIREAIVDKKLDGVCVGQLPDLKEITAASEIFNPLTVKRVKIKCSAQLCIGLPPRVCPDEFVDEND